MVAIIVRPTIGFQMVCVHTRKINHISRPFYGRTDGATNDITIIFNDTYPREVMFGLRHNDRIFKT